MSSYRKVVERTQPGATLVGGPRWKMPGGGPVRRQVRKQRGGPRTLSLPDKIRRLSHLSYTLMEAAGTAPAFPQAIRTASPGLDGRHFFAPILLPLQDKASNRRGNTPNQVHEGSLWRGATKSRAENLLAGRGVS